jgi:hypothetical protein
MTTQRTEDQVLAKAPITVTLGVKEYQIKLLSIKAQREWRQKMSQEMQEVVNQFAPTSKAPNAGVFSAGLTVALTQFPEKLTELVFAYAPDLPREQIMEDATEEQISVAFSKIVQVAFPFLAHLGMVKAAIQAS